MYRHHYPGGELYFSKIVECRGSVRNVDGKESEIQNKEWKRKGYDFASCEKINTDRVC